MKNDGPVKILNKELVPNYTIINAVEQTTSGKELFVTIINKTQEIELILDNNFTNCTLLFAGSTNITEIDLSKFNSDSITDIRYMFFNCTSLKSINFAGFNTTNVIYMNAMFANCSSLISLNISNFNMQAVKQLVSMFFDCQSLKSLYLPAMSTTQIINYNYMFYNCYSLKSLNLSKWNISNVHIISFNSMFYNCTSLTSLNISNFDTNSINFLGVLFGMFEGCKNLRYLNVLKLQGSPSYFYYENIFKNTPENMVICFSDNVPLYFIFRNKTCGVITCDENWEKKQKKINNETGECMNKCEGDFRYEYNTKCYRKCPKGSIFNETSNICEECNFDECNISKLTNEEKKEFVEDTINKIKDGTLDILLSSLVNSGKDVVINNKEEIYAISTTNSQNFNESRSKLDLGDCERELRKVYNLNDDEKIIIFKIEKYLLEYKIPIIAYELFSQNGKINFDMDYCKNIKISTYIKVDIDENILYKYNPNDKYYNNRCQYHTSENSTDIPLFDRQNEFNNNMSLCESNCEYKGYDSLNKLVECKCKVKNLEEFYSEKRQLLYKFKNIKIFKTNIDLIKCLKTAFSKEGLKSNIGFYLLLCIILISIICSIYFYGEGYNSYITRINYLINMNEIKEDKDESEKEENINDSNNSDIKNKSRNSLIQLEDNSKISKNITPIVPTFTQNITFTFNDTFSNNNNNDSLNKDSQKSENINIDIIQLKDNNKSKNVIQFNSNNDIHLNNTSKKNNIIKKSSEKKLNLNDCEMNNLVYEKAYQIDKRDFLKCYISLIKTKQLIILTFCMDKDYNLGVIKFMLLFLSFAISYGINVLFFTDSAIHKIYIEHGKYDFGYQLPKIIYSTIISKVIETLLSFLSITDINISELRKKKDEEKTKEREKLVKYIMNKFIIFILLNYIFLIYIWFYLTAFCAVYKNTQVHHLKNSLTSFGASLVYPFIYYLLPPFIRTFALKEKTEKKNLLYKCSLILQMF